MRMNEKVLRAYVRSILQEQGPPGRENDPAGAEEDAESDGVDNDQDGEVDEEGETAEEQADREDEEALGEDGVDEDVENKSQAVEELKAFIENGIPQIPNAQLDALMDQFKVLAQQAADGKLAAKEEEIQKDVAQNTGDDDAEAAAEDAENKT